MNKITLNCKSVSIDLNTLSSKIREMIAFEIKDPIFLDILCEDKNVDVRTAVVENPNTPIQTLIKFKLQVHFKIGNVLYISYFRLLNIKIKKNFFLLRERSSFLDD